MITIEPLAGASSIAVRFTSGVGHLGCPGNGYALDSDVIGTLKYGLQVKFILELVIRV